MKRKDIMEHDRSGSRDWTRGPEAPISRMRHIPISQEETLAKGYRFPCWGVGDNRCWVKGVYAEDPYACPHLVW
jgi:hypothetical protein